MLIDISKLDKEAKRKYWLEVINNFQQSGIRLKDYCTENGLKYDHMAYYWQQYKKKNQEQETTAAEFIPIQLDTIINSQYIIKIDNTIEVKLPSSSSLNQVAALIAEIRRKA